MLSRCCILCDKITLKSRPFTLEGHFVRGTCNVINNFFNIKNNVAECNFCSQKFKCYFECTKHMFVDHFKNKVQCSICKEFVQLSSLKAHKLAHFFKIITSEIIVCKCGNFEDVPKQFIRHLVTAHEKPVQKLTKVVIERSYNNISCNLVLIVLLYEKWKISKI